MTGKAGVTLVDITAHPGMIIIGIRFLMATQTTKDHQVARRGVALRTGIPRPLVAPAEDGEVLGIVVEGGRIPFRFGVAASTVRGEADRTVVGGIGGIVIIQMAAHAGVGRIGIVSVVASGAIVGDPGVGSIEGIIIIVHGKRSRHPVRRCRMADHTICGDSQGCMSRIAAAIVVCIMTGKAGRGRSCKPVGMAGDTIDADMGFSERKVGGIVIKGSIRRTVGMTTKTGATLIGIAGNAAVFVIRPRIAMAGRTGKFGDIIGIGMAIHAIVPFSLVLSTVNGEELGVVVVKGGRHPTCIGRMTLDTIRRQPQGHVIRTEGRVEICLVAADTFRRGIRKIPGRMALITILNIMSQREREKVMRNRIGVPAKAQGTMTIGTTGRIACRNMIGTLGTGIVFPVAADALVADAVKAEVGLPKVTLHATEIGMGANQRKAIFFV